MHMLHVNGVLAVAGMAQNTFMCLGSTICMWVQSVHTAPHTARPHAWLHMRPWCCTHDTLTHPLTAPAAGVHTDTCTHTNSCTSRQRTATLSTLLHTKTRQGALRSTCPGLWKVWLSLQQLAQDVWIARGQYGDPDPAFIHMAGWAHAQCPKVLRRLRERVCNSLTPACVETAAERQVDI